MRTDRSMSTFIAVAAYFALALLSTGSSAARAAIMYSFDQPSYDLQLGQSVTVPVELVFTDADASQLLADGGLLSAAVRVVQSGPTPTGPVTLTDIAANTTDFDDPTLTPIIIGPSGDTAAVWEFANLTRSAGVIGQPLAAGSYSVGVGSITFTAGNTPGQTSFQATRYDPSLDTTVTFNNPPIVLDGSIQTALVTINVVPDPAGGMGALLLVLGFILRRR